MTGRFQRFYFWLQVYERQFGDEHHLGLVCQTLKMQPVDYHVKLQALLTQTSDADDDEEMESESDD